MGIAPAEVTQILKAHVAGDREAKDRLLPLIYEDLKALAAKYMRGERPGHSLEPTMLAHDAFMRLVDHDQIDWQDRTHFFALAATTVRRLLVDHARARQAEKRGGDAQRVSLNDRDRSACHESPDPVAILSLHEAIEKLKASHPRQALLVDMRFFGGLTVEETAQALGVSKDTAKADWRLARTWLNRELKGEGAADQG